MDSENIQPGLSKPRKGKVVEIRYYPIPEEKVEVYIREVIRVKPEVIAAVKYSLEEWSKQWD